MKTTACWLFALTLLLSAGCGKQKAPTPPGGGTTNTAAGPPAATNQPNYSSGNPLTAPVDYLGAVAQAQKRAVKTIDLTSLTQAIQLFQSMEGRLPKDLNELVAERYLGKIPDAPYGSKIVYDAKTGQVKIVPQ